jgi:hypothetical protein
MAKEQKLDWFGADVDDDPNAKTTAAELHGFKGVDADVPRSVRQEDGTVATVMVRKPAPTYLRAKTTAGERTDHDIARKTARFKMAREGFNFAPPDDKEMWERRRDLAFAEMQIARFRAKLARYEAGENVRPEQVQLYKNTIAMWRGRFAELSGQE